MLVAMASRPPMAASASDAQNTHQVGPKTRASPPATNATTIRVTATQETARPWNAGLGVNAPVRWWASTRSPGLAPVIAGSAAASLVVLGCSWSVMRAAPLVLSRHQYHHCGQGLRRAAPAPS